MRMLRKLMSYYKGHFDKKRCKAANHLGRNSSLENSRVMKFNKNSSRRLYKAKPLYRFRLNSVKPSDEIQAHTTAYAVAELGDRGGG